MHGRIWSNISLITVFISKIGLTHQAGTIFTILASDYTPFNPSRTLSYVYLFIIYLLFTIFDSAVLSQMLRIYNQI